MFRVGILGAENSHAMAFAKIFNNCEPQYEGLFPEIRVVAVGGNYPEANREVFEKCGLELIVEKPEDMLGKVDAVMVTARDGKYHAPFARPFIEVGIPAFIDKPFTSDAAEALEFVRAAKAKGVPLTGGSSLKLVPAVVGAGERAAALGDKLMGGSIVAPVSMVNDYGDFWFYSAHLAEMCLKVFGPEIQWVWASRSAKGVTVIVHYPAFDATMHYTDGAYNYAVTLNTADGIEYMPVGLGDFCLLEAQIFADMLHTGKMEQSYEDMIRPVYVLEAIEKSFRTGERQEIPEIRV